MSAVIDTTFFGLIHDFFKVYLPVQRHCSEHTIRAYRSAMDAFLEFVKAEKHVELPQITFKMIDNRLLSGFLDSLEESGCSISTRNHRLACIRAFYDYAAKIEPTTVVYFADIQKVPKKNPVKPNIVDYMNETAIKALLAQPDILTKKGFRDRFLMLMLYDTAARVQEILDIRLCDIKLGKTPTVTLHGKGSKIRTVPIMKQTAEHYRQYLKQFHLGENEHSERYLFYTVMHGEQHPLCDSTVRRITYAYGDAARKTCKDVPEKVHPHLLRHYGESYQMVSDCS